MTKEEFEKRAAEEAQKHAEDRFPERLYGDHLTKRSADDFISGALWGHAQGCADERARILALLRSEEGDK